MNNNIYIQLIKLRDMPCVDVNNVVVNNVKIVDVAVGR